MSHYIHTMSEPREVTEKRIAARIAGRTAAEELRRELVSPPSDGFAADWAESFVETMRASLPQRRAKEGPEKPEPIARLGQLQMVFGAHKGQPFDDIPLDYLDWLCRTQEDFYKSLRAYLKHPELESHRGERP